MPDLQLPEPFKNWTKWTPIFKWPAILFLGFEIQIGSLFSCLAGPFLALKKICMPFLFITFKASGKNMKEN
jgi:hypothetical protein